MKVFSAKGVLACRVTFLCLILWSMALCRAGAATNTVTSAADSGPGTLREALASAANGDIIVFAPGLDG